MNHKNMKKLLIMLAAVVLTAATLSAQVAPGMKYRELKNLYNARDYVPSSVDPYSKGWAGAASFFVPGLGQAVCGEVGRGFAFFGGEIAFDVVGSVFANKMLSYVQKDANGKYVTDSNGHYVYTDEKAARNWALAIAGVGVANLAYLIWDICDARKVAKVKNMYYQDLMGVRAMEVNLYPSVDLAMTANGTKPVAGFTLSMQF